MSGRVLNFLLLLAFLATLGLYAATGRDLRQRNVEAMPEMVRSPAYATFAPNPNFPDGKTLQLPEPGTIRRGRLPLHYGPSAELRNPFAAADTRARERGAFLYVNYCAMCHGPEGKGDGPVPQRGIPLPASLQGENAVQMKDGQMFHVLTFGWRNMASHAAQLAPDDRWKVILHVRALQQQAALVLVSAVGHAGGLPNLWQAGWTVETMSHAQQAAGDKRP
jgi:mono/diheme cytochrome c family protein